MSLIRFGWHCVWIRIDVWQTEVSQLSPGKKCGNADVHAGWELTETSTRSAAVCRTLADAAGSWRAYASLRKCGWWKAVTILIEIHPRSSNQIEVLHFFPALWEQNWFKWLFSFPFLCISWGFVSLKLWKLLFFFTCMAFEIYPFFLLVLSWHLCHWNHSLWVLQATNLCVYLHSSSFKVLWWCKGVLQ